MEQIALQPHHHSCLAKLVFLRFTHKISAVDKDHAIALSGILRGVRLCKHYRRIVLMAGGAPAASNHVVSVGNRLPLGDTLHGVSAAKAYHIIISRNEVQAGGSRLFHNHLTAALIDNLGASCDNILRLQHPIQELNQKPARTVFHENFQRIGFVFPGINRRKSF